MSDLATGRDIILQVVDSMRRHGEPLYESTVHPCAYQVTLHPEDYRRLEGLLPEIGRQARRALDEELARLNRELAPVGRLRSALGRPRMPHRALAPWTVEVFPDPNEELARGDIAVSCELIEPVAPDFGSGSRTRRVVTTRRGADLSTTETSVAVESAPAAAPPPQPPEPAAPPAFAVLTWEDEGGPQTFRMEKPQLVIGRGGRDYWVDVKLRTVPDVSREHVRLRRDEATGQFFIKDLSTLGTTVDGQRIPPSLEGEGRERRDRNIEVPLPAVAVIGLAGAVFVQFRAERGHP